MPPTHSKFMVNKAEPQYYPIFYDRGLIEKAIQIQRHIGSKCKACPCMKNLRFCMSRMTGVTHTIKAEIQVDCKTENVVYVITCECGFQYVGHTIRDVAKRMNHHRSQINKAKTIPGFLAQCQVLCDHFAAGTCDFKYAKITIIEHVPFTQEELNNIEKTKQDNKKRSNKQDRDRHLQDAMHPQRVRIHEREMFWIKTMRTAYPYGLNDQLDQQNQYTTLEEMFTPIAPERIRWKKAPEQRKVRKSPKPKFVAKEVFDAMLSTIKRSHYWIRNIRVQLDATRHRKLRVLHTHISNVLHDSPNALTKQVAILVLEMIDHRTRSRSYDVLPKSSPEVIWKIFFDNTGFNDLHLERILHTPELEKLMPRTEPDTPTICPTIVYTYHKTIRNKLFNYKKVVEKLTRVDLELHQTEALTQAHCKCQERHPNLCDSTHHHVITGDFSIIKNDKLRQLFHYGPQFRERTVIDWDEVQQQTFLQLDATVESLAKKTKRGIHEFEPWKEKLTQLINARLTLLRSRAWPIYTSVFDDPDALRCLRDLQEHFVIAPADKASGNIILICKHYYYHVLYKELLGNPLDPQTYKLQKNCNPDELLQQLKQTFEKTIPFQAVAEDNLHLPTFHWQAKMHKTPIKARFLAACNKSVDKQLSTDITACLRAVQQQLQQHYRYQDRGKGINRFWIIDNTKRLIDRIDTLNGRGRPPKSKPPTIDTYDFSTLYTMIPHEKLKQQLRWVINVAFQSTNRKIIKIRRDGKQAFLAETVGNDNYWQQTDLLKAIDTLLDNIYIQCGDMVFKQVIGIPMGTSCAPYLANLFLFAYEAQWIDRLWAKGKKTLAREIAQQCNSSFRYIDDLCTLNFEMEKHIGDIYPPEMTVKKQNKESHTASFMDLLIQVKSNKFHTSLYDKRDDFDFEIVCFPFTASNIHFSKSHGVIQGQLKRFAENTTASENFFTRTRELVKRLTQQGFSRKLLEKNCCKFYRRRPKGIRHLHLPTESQFIYQIFHYEDTDGIQGVATHDEVYPELDRGWIEYNTQVYGNINKRKHEGQKREEENNHEKRQCRRDRV